VFLILMACYPPAIAGLWIDGGGSLTWLWMALFGVGTSVFPLILTLFGLRARTPAGTSALSSFAQSGGYLIAGAGPLAVGWVYGLTGSWSVPFGFIAALTAVLFFAGLYVIREQFIEDELAPAPTAGLYRGRAPARGCSRASGADSRNSGRNPPKRPPPQGGPSLPRDTIVLWATMLWKSGRRS
jgi:hypothetical protein